MHDGPDFNELRRVLLLEGEPHSVPLVEPQVEIDVKSAFLGKPVADLASDIQFWVSAGYDYIPLTAGVRSRLLLRSSEYQSDQDRDTLGSGRSAEARYSLYSDGASEREWAEEGQGVIRSRADFERFPWPDLDQCNWSVFDEVKRFLPPGMKVIARIGAIFLPTWQMMGFESFCEALADDPELVQSLLDKFGSLECATVQRLLDYDSVGAIWFAEDIAYAESLMIAPKYLRKSVFPWYKRIGDLCQAGGLPYIHHSDGKLYQVIDDLIECGVRALHPIEPKAMDIVRLKKQYGSRLCLCGNIDLAYTLTLGSPQEVEAEVKQRIHDVAPGGGYCMGSSNSIPEYVPLANYVAMRAATFRYGRYPIAVG